MKEITFTACLFVLPLLSSCDGATSETAEKPSGAQSRWIDVPALPILQNAVMAISPTVEPQSDAWAMRHMCGLARGELSQFQVNQSLVDAGVDVTKAPENGSVLALLMEGDIAQRSTICGVYLVKTLLSPPIDSDFMTASEGNGNTQLSQPTRPNIDAALSNQAMMVKLAVAKATADVFALMAHELQQEPRLTVEQYTQRTQKLFSSL